MTVCGAHNNDHCTHLTQTENDSAELAKSTSNRSMQNVARTKQSFVISFRFLHFGQKFKFKSESKWTIKQSLALRAETKNVVKKILFRRIALSGETAADMSSKLQNCSAFKRQDSKCFCMSWMHCQTQF